MKDVIKDYAIYAMLLTVFAAMVGSALMLIRTMSVSWFFITAGTTALAMFASVQKYDNYSDEDLKDLDDDKEP